MIKASGAAAPDPAAEDEDTILAVSSAPGTSALCVLRLSGPQAIAAVADRAPRASPALHGSRGFTELDVCLCLPQGQIRARASVFRAPRSYTREDVVELTLPGSPPLVQLVARALLTPRESGNEPTVRWAQPGELTLRAFLNGRIDIEQAEGVAALIAATGEAEARAAQRSLRGELGSRLRGLRDGLIECLALIEAALDFPDEDLPQVSSEALLRRLRACRDDLTALRRSCALRLPGPGTLRVVLWGLPNAGKSSLLNALLGRRAAIASPLAGTTRDPVRGVTEHGGRRVEWIDVAGTWDPEAGALGGERDDQATIWQAVRRLTEIEVAQADIVLWVVDPSGDLEAACRGWERLKVARKLVLIQKADLLTTAMEAQLQSPLAGAIRTSAHRRTGLGELVVKVLATFDSPTVAPGLAAGPVPELILSTRQAVHLELMEAAIARGNVGLLSKNAPFECVAGDLRDALSALEELVGTAGREAVLDLVFARFCIGK